ncbi:MAG: c-type cytochrome [Candidatus Velthaea sp.]|jgi:cytochrome c553
MRQPVVFRAFVTAGLVAVLIGGAAGAARSGLDWAFPTAGSDSGQASKPARALTLASSPAHYTRSEIESGFVAIDWWPHRHSSLPAVVERGRKPDVLACGFCHLPSGQGRPENFALAGLGARYMREQLRDLRSGARRGVHPAWLPAAVMTQVAHAVTEAEVASATAYFAKQTFVPRTRVVETAEIPAVTAEAFVYRRLPGNRRETLGERIVETPDDFGRFELRDSTVGYTAYVPRGSLARGAELARTGANDHVTACIMCHGANLRGVGDVPPLAGRSPTQLFRQLAGFRARTRHGAGDAPMLAETAPLSNAEMIDVAAYAGSLKP